VGVSRVSVQARLQIGVPLVERGYEDNVEAEST